MVNQQSMLDKNKRYSLRLPSDNVSENEHFKLCRFSWTSVRFLLLEFKWKGFLARLNSNFFKWVCAIYFFLKFIHEKMGFSRNSPYLLKISISETVFTWKILWKLSLPPGIFPYFFSFLPMEFHQNFYHLLEFFPVFLIPPPGIPLSLQKGGTELFSGKA